MTRRETNSMTMRIPAMAMKKAAGVESGSMAANLATSTCARRLNNTIGLIEIADLDGADSEINEEELEQFIASFPIDPWGPAGAR